MILYFYHYADQIYKVESDSFKMKIVSMLRCREPDWDFLFLGILIVLVNLLSKTQKKPKFGLKYWTL